MPVGEVYEKLKELGITLQRSTPATSSYVPAVRTGDLLFVSGHVAKRDGQPWVGQLGRDLTTEEGQRAARAVAIDLLGTLEVETGDLGRIRRIVKLMVLVNSIPTFTEQHLVANGASQLFLDVFAKRGAHARSSFGVTQVPFGCCVEIELIAEVE